MFPCGCSLRSTQCAALIALATAAGIMRIESTASEVVTPAFESRATVLGSARVEHHFQPSRYQVALQVLAPWLRVFGFSLDTGAGSTTSLQAAAVVAENDHASAQGHGDYFGASSPHAALPLPTAVSAPVVDFFAWTASAPTTRQHAIPFAVGPPRHELASSLRVDGTRVPGDLVARRMSVSAIALSSVSISDARRERVVSLSPRWAGLPFMPSFVLRGEPVRANSLASAFGPFSDAFFAPGTAGVRPFSTSFLT